jgi:hypothetical protein
MTGRFEDLWDSADDGASCPAHVFATGTSSDEVDHLIDAWFRERSDRIECSLLLDQARRLIVGLMAEGEMTPLRRRQAARFLRASRCAPNPSSNEDGG